MKEALGGSDITDNTDEGQNGTNTSSKNKMTPEDDKELEGVEDQL